MKYVLIHGLGQNSSSWNKTLSFMEKKEIFVCIDLLEIIENKDCNYNNINNAKLLFLKKSGHTVNEDNPEELALKIIEFYESGRK